MLSIVERKENEVISSQNSRKKLNLVTHHYLNSNVEKLYSLCPVDQLISYNQHKCLNINSYPAA